VVPVIFLVLSVRSYSGMEREGKQLRRKLHSTDRSAGMKRQGGLPKPFQSVHVADARNQHPLHMTQPQFVLEGTSRGVFAVSIRKGAPSVAIIRVASHQAPWRSLSDSCEHCH
jgi:hypothetical protein